MKAVLMWDVFGKIDYFMRRPNEYTGLYRSRWFTSRLSRVVLLNVAIAVVVAVRLIWECLDRIS